MPDLIEQAREVGFNTQLQLGAHSIHVQTEVIGLTAIVIRTTVMEAGVIRFAESTPCPTESGDIDAVRAAVESRHLHVIEMVQRGEGT